MITSCAMCEALAWRWGRRGLIVLTLLLACFLSYKAVHNQLTETIVLAENRVSIARYLDGTAVRPFAHRILTPMLMRFVQDVLDIGDLLAAAPSFVQDKVSVICAKATASPPATCTSVMSYATVAYCYFLAFLAAIWFLSMRIFKRNTVIALGAVGLSFLAVNSLVLLGLSHIYDFGVLMFVTLLLLCLEFRKPALFCVVLALACLNKESSILYLFAFFFVNLDRMRFRQNLAYCAVQVIAFVLIYGSIRLYFAHNEGQGLEFYLFPQISFFSEKYTLAYLLWTLPLCALVFYHFKQKNETLQRASVVMLPWIALYVLGAVPREIRVIFEILPLVLMLTMESMVSLVLGEDWERARRIEGATGA